MTSDEIQQKISNLITSNPNKEMMMRKIEGNSKFASQKHIDFQKFKMSDSQGDIRNLVQ